MGASVALAVLGSGVPGFGDSTSLELGSPGEIKTNRAHRDATYNIGLPLYITGPGAVRLVSVRATDVDAGLDHPDSVVGWGCDGKETFAAAVGADLSRKPRSDVRPLAQPTLREADGPCWYVLLRFVPRRHGLLAARDGEIVYRVGRRTVRERFAFATSFDVDRDGPDPREKPDVR